VVALRVVLGDFGAPTALTCTLGGLRVEGVAGVSCAVLMFATQH
jgi:hypothetical protein